MDHEPQTWNPRLTAADAELQDAMLPADQPVLNVRARILELASLLSRITSSRNSTNSATVATEEDGYVT
jgi:hypothetical protein